MSRNKFYDTRKYINSYQVIYIIQINLHFALTAVGTFTSQPRMQHDGQELGLPPDLRYLICLYKQKFAADSSRTLVVYSVYLVPCTLSYYELNLVNTALMFYKNQRHRL